MIHTAVIIGLMQMTLGYGILLAGRVDAGVVSIDQLRQTLARHGTDLADANIHELTWRQSDGPAGAADTLTILRGAYAIYAAGEARLDDVHIIIADKGTGSVLGDYVLQGTPGHPGTLVVPTSCICLVSATPPPSVLRHVIPYHVAIGLVRKPGR